MKVFKTVLFWVLSCTWGFLLTFIGLFVALGFLCFGIKPKKFGYSFYFEIGRSWGGLSIGPVFFVNEGASEYLKQHEAGHSLQNCYFGPLTIFLISIPSAMRYWIREELKNQINRYKGVFFSLGSMIILGIILTILGEFTLSYFLGVFNFILGIFITLYTSILLIWLIKFEIPKYESGMTEYDDIWFERSATGLGKIFKK